MLSRSFCMSEGCTVHDEGTGNELKLKIEHMARRGSAAWEFKEKSERI